MNNYEGKYFEFGINAIIHIKEVHHQISRAIALVEIDDWVGNISFGWNLKNNNEMIELDLHVLASLKETTKDEFLIKLQTQLESTIDEIKQCKGYVTTLFKKTDERTEIFRKHYGIKS